MLSPEEIKIAMKKCIHDDSCPADCPGHYKQGASGSCFAVDGMVGDALEYIELLEERIAIMEEVNTHTQEIFARYHDKDIEKLAMIPNGDWCDLRASGNYELKAGDFALISLGVSMKLPDGYEAHIAPRSSTFKKWGVIQTNGVGIVDNSYSGDDDVWLMPVYATRDTVIETGDRVCQFRIMKKMEPVKFTEVEHLDGANRSGFVSMGTK